MFASRFFVRWCVSWIIYFTLGAHLVASAQPAQTESGNAYSRSASSELQTFLNLGVSKGIPGISAVVATKEGIIWSGVAGNADVQSGTLVTTDMLFGIGSVTKTFVAVVILQLAEEGILDLCATPASILGKTMELLYL